MKQLISIGAATVVLLLTTIASAQGVCSPPADTDGDGFPDSTDVCFCVADDGNGSGNCQEGGDRDGDGVPDDQDACQGSQQIAARDSLKNKRFDDTRFTSDGCNCSDMMEVKPGNDDEFLDHGCPDSFYGIWEDRKGWAKNAPSADPPILCDPCERDYDGDGVGDCDDNCVFDCNPGQEDSTGDGVGDVCDTDCDDDGVEDGVDNCQCTYNPGQENQDEDDLGDVCDVCPGDPNKDDDEGVCGCGVSDIDNDTDGTPDCNDQCPDDPTRTVPIDCGCGADDTDGDGAFDCEDQCPNDVHKILPGECGCGESENDSDSDGIPDCNDTCDGNGQDTDGDGIADCEDNCLDDPNPGQEDSDGDGVGDACACNENSPDSDGDGVPDCEDVCPTVYDPKQMPCKCAPVQPGEPDRDGDGVVDYCDNCLFAGDPNTFNTYDSSNPDQMDSDNDGWGDACDFCPGTTVDLAAVCADPNSNQCHYTLRDFNSTQLSRAERRWFRMEPYNAAADEVFRNGCTCQQLNMKFPRGDNRDWCGNNRHRDWNQCNDATTNPKEVRCPSKLSATDVCEGKLNGVTCHLRYHIDLLPEATASELWTDPIQPGYSGPVQYPYLDQFPDGVPRFYDETFSFPKMQGFDCDGFARYPGTSAGRVGISPWCVQVVGPGPY